ncbi:uncharacterized protein DC041_0004472 [Schistosoma bovis]|uniref:Uncharacterized protein n=1 Tax=Schistosoma bovis TaxID=6184 RepID=A0A430Q7M1_SCHBO|nr:uncharacterized protein DC041_0004472 [Schistosoma bovis]
MAFVQKLYLLHAVIIQYVNCLGHSLVNVWNALNHFHGVGMVMNVVQNNAVGSDV